MIFKSLVSQLGKPLNPAEALTGRSSRWIADKFGVSMRTAQRWKRGTQQPTARDGRRARVMRSADRRKVSAQTMRDASAVNAGTVEVEADTGRLSARSGTRNVGFVQLDGSARERMRRAANALEHGDMTTAEELFSDAVLNTSGRNYGPLRISDYPPGFHLI